MSDLHLDYNDSSEETLNVENRESFCTNCGARLHEGSKFCSNCGTSIINKSENSTKRKQEFAGKIIKCPNCGEVLKAFEQNCPVCGYEIREAKSTTSISEFAAKLEELETNRDPDHSKKTDKQIKNLIRSFAVPNTKEDLIEFLALASSNINSKRYSDAWEAKYEQVYQKAMYSFGDGPEFEEIKKLYEIKQKEIERKREEIKRSERFENLFYVGIIILCVAVTFGIFIMWEKDDTTKEQLVQEENTRLEQVMQEIYQAVENKDYDLARLKIATLVYSGPYSAQSEKYWKNVQKEMLEVINNEKNISDISTEESNHLEE